MSLLDTLHTGDVPLLDGASGAALVFQARTHLIGVTPSVEQVQGIVRDLENAAASSSARPPGALPGELESPASGTLVFAIDAVAGEYVLWFARRGVPVASVTEPAGVWDGPSPWSAADRALAANVTHSMLLKSKRKLAELVARLHEEQRGRARAFVAVGHELRNALGILGGWTHVLRTNPPGTEHGSRAIEVLDRSVRIQRKLLDDLLQTSKHGFSPTTLDLHDVDLLRLVEDMLAASRPAVDEKSLRLEVELDPELGVVRGDTERLGQVIANLLANAVKFTPRGGAIRVAARRSERYVEIRISDTGIGIAMDFLPHVFDAFRQAEPTSMPSSGLGLGLTIAKQLVELHGGQLIAESAGLGAGATFRMLLPVCAGD